MGRGPDRLLRYAGRVPGPWPWLGGGQVLWNPVSPPPGVLQHGRALGTLLSLQLSLPIQRDKMQFRGPGMRPLPGCWLCWPSPLAPALGGTPSGRDSVLGGRPLPVQSPRDPPLSRGAPGRPGPGAGATSTLSPSSGRLCLAGWKQLSGQRGGSCHHLPGVLMGVGRTAALARAPLWMVFLLGTV